MTAGSITESAPRCTSAAPGSSDFWLPTSDSNRGTPGTHRAVDRGQRSNHAEAELAAGDRRAAAVHGVDEVGALVLERLARLDLRADDVAVADQQLELAVRVGDRLAHRDAALEHAHALDVVQIVEHHAPAAAD